MKIINAKIVDPERDEICEGSLGIEGEEYDAKGAYVLPGFIDAHVHIESSHLTPSQFGRALIQHGTTTAVCDPHEIANVMGEEGLRFMLEDAKASPVDLFFELPSCVPATPNETNGAILTAADTARLFDKYTFIALGEMMNVPGVLNHDKEVMAKLAAAKARGKIIEGHFPFGMGEALKQYAAAGITSDHESCTAQEAIEKVAAGMTVFIREGSSARNLDALIGVVNETNEASFCFCADDISAADCVVRGDIINCVRRAVAQGMPPMRAVRLATLNAARYFGWAERGRIPTGELTDLVIVKDLQAFEVIDVIKDGRLVAVKNSVHLPDLTALHVAAPKQGEQLIGVLSTEIVTKRIVYDGSQEIAHLVVIERHGKNGNIATANCTGTNLQRGAIATTIAHDSHNLIILGTNENDMRTAAHELAKCGGGATVVIDGEVRALFPMRVAGLMSDASASDVAALDSAFKLAAKETGCTLPEPLITLSFLALPVIPEIRLTDKGLVIL